MRDREIPVLSFDFFYTGKSMGEQSDVEGLKLTELVAHDSHSGSLMCFPLKGKDDACSLRDGELSAILRAWCSILVVQSLLQRTWQRKGFRVVIENSKVLDHGDNALLRNQLTGFEVWLVFC